MLDDEFIDLVIKEIKNLWPECMMVRGSPHHSESNGGVERVNQTVQKKLGGWMKTNKSNNWVIGCRMAMWRINTQVHQTMKDMPYHITYGQHPCVGISNLPVSAAILQNLSTEAELQDLYSTMNVDGVALPAPLSTTDGSYRKDLPPDDAGLDDAILEIAIATADKLVPQRPLGKRKERSAQLPSHLSRELRDAKRQEMAMVVLRDHAKEKDIASPSEGKNRDEREVPSSTRWLEMMENRDRLELEEIAHARVNSVFPIIYCTNIKDINDMRLFRLVSTIEDSQSD